MRLKTALRRLVEEHRPVVWMTAQQNLIVGGLRPERRTDVEQLLTDHGVPLTGAFSQTVRNSMACPAVPTCGLAVAESERVLPDLARRIERLAAELGLAEERISFRMTGCPNGCARPYLGDVGFVGTTLGKYDVFLGGDFVGTRLNSLFAHNVPIGDIPALLRGPLAGYAVERQPGEGFGDWCHRTGMEALRERFAAEAAPA
jgi:sulfite reductase (ferredoxin)